MWVEVYIYVWVEVYIYICVCVVQLLHMATWYLVRTPPHNGCMLRMCVAYTIIALCWWGSPATCVVCACSQPTTMWHPHAVVLCIYTRSIHTCIYTYHTHTPRTTSCMLYTRTIHTHGYFHVFLVLYIHHYTPQYKHHHYQVLLGQKYDTSADMWSFACMVFELVTGDLLFEPKSGRDYDRDEDHLALMMELLGRMPKKVRRGGWCRCGCGVCIGCCVGCACMCILFFLCIALPHTHHCPSPHTLADIHTHTLTNTLTNTSPTPLSHRWQVQVGMPMTSSTDMVNSDIYTN